VESSLLPRAPVRLRPPGRRGPEDCGTGALASCFIPEAALLSSGCNDRELLLRSPTLGRNSIFQEVLRKRGRDYLSGTRRCLKFVFENRLDQLGNWITFCAVDREKDEQTETKKRQKQVVELFGGKTCGWRITLTPKYFIHGSPIVIDLFHRPRCCCH